MRSISQILFFELLAAYMAKIPQCKGAQKHWKTYLKMVELFDLKEICDTRKLRSFLFRGACALPVFSWGLQNAQRDFKALPLERRFFRHQKRQKISQNFSKDLRSFSNVLCLSFETVWKLCYQIYKKVISAVFDGFSRFANYFEAFAFFRIVFRAPKSKIFLTFAPWRNKCKDFLSGGLQIYSFQ